MDTKSWRTAGRGDEHRMAQPQRAAYAPQGRLPARIVRASLGLAICSMGSYLMIQANVGLSPWDCLNMGLSLRTGLSYGTCSVLISVIIIILDLLMKEHIGIGTLLDAVICGLCVDLWRFLGLVPMQHTLLGGIAVCVAAQFAFAFGQCVYMKAALCCGPRDSLLVGVGKRLSRWPIGAVNAALFAAVLLLGMLMRGPVGLGTVIGVFGMGAAFQLAVRIMRFEPRAVRHESLWDLFAKRHG